MTQGRGGEAAVAQGEGEKSSGTGEAEERERGWGRERSGEWRLGVWEAFNPNLLAIYLMCRP